MTDGTDPRAEAEAALMNVVDDFGGDCADRMNLPFKYGEYRMGEDTPERKDVRQAALAWVIAELEAQTYVSAGRARTRIHELRARREQP